MDRFLQDINTTTTAKTILVGGNTNGRMRDLTTKTLLRLCGEEQGDYHIAWRRLSTGWGLISTLDLKVMDICTNIIRQLKWFVDVLHALKENKGTTSEVKERIQGCIDKIRTTSNSILQLNDLHVIKGQKPVYLWDVLPFKCDEITAKAVLSHLFPNDKELRLDVDEFIKGYEAMEDKCKEETAGAENEELARQRWWKNHNNLVNYTSYGVYNMADDKLTIDMSAFPSKSKAVRSTLEFIVDVPSFCDVTLQMELSDILKRLVAKLSYIGKLINMEEVTEQPYDTESGCFVDLMSALHRFYQRKGMEDECDSVSEEECPVTAEKVDTVQNTMDHDKDSHFDNIVEEESNADNVPSETEGEDENVLDEEYKDDVDEASYEDFMDEEDADDVLPETESEDENVFDEEWEHITLSEIESRYLKIKLPKLDDEDYGALPKTAGRCEDVLDEEWKDNTPSGTEGEDEDFMDEEDADDVLPETEGENEEIMDDKWTDNMPPETEGENEEFMDEEWKDNTPSETEGENDNDVDETSYEDFIDEETVDDKGTVDDEEDVYYKEDEEPKEDKKAEDVKDEIDHEAFVAYAWSFFDRCYTFKEQIAKALQNKGKYLFGDLDPSQIELRWDGKISSPEDIVIRIMLMDYSAAAKELDAIMHLLHAKDLVIEIDGNNKLVVSCPLIDNQQKC